METEQQPHRSGRGGYDVPYVAPMAVFLGVTQMGVWWPSLYVVSYVAKTLIVSLLLVRFWNRYTKIRWTHAWLGAAVGVLGLVQWVGLETVLLHWWPDYPRPSVPIFDPVQAITSPSARWLFIAVRWAGASLLVPVMEELFWRDFLWRTIASPGSFRRVDVGVGGAAPLLIVPVMFATVHVQWITACVWALLIGLLLLRTKSLGACIVAHGVTNGLLGAYVLYTGDWYFW